MVAKRRLVETSEANAPEQRAPAVVLAFPRAAVAVAPVPHVGIPSAAEFVGPPARPPVLPVSPATGERLTIVPRRLRDWLRLALIVSLAVHLGAFAAMHLRFEDDLERAAGSAAMLASDGTITIPIEIVVESILPSAPAPTDANASDASEAVPTPEPVEPAAIEETPPVNEPEPVETAVPPETSLAELSELLPPPPEPSAVVMPEPELPPPPEPAPVVLPSQEEARRLILAEEEIAPPLEAETGAVAEVPPPAVSDVEPPPLPAPRPQPPVQRDEQAPARQEARRPAPAKQAAPSTPSRAAAPSRAASARSAPGTAGSGGRTESGGRAAISSYQARVLAHLTRHRVYPPEARSRGVTGTTRVQFALGRNGEVLSVSLAGGSGARVLDEAALAMVRRAAPFPPFPPELSQSRLAFGAPIRFDLR